jgi:3-hydroxybutyryl-CoA dehydrogenase
MTVSDSVTELDELLLLETEGETALALSVKHRRPVVVYDLCASDTVVLAAAATNAGGDDKAVHYFQQQGKKVLRSPIIPACWCGARWRCWLTKRWTRCKKGSPARRISIPPCALASTTRRPAGVGESLGWRRVLRLLENLQHHYGEERYRPCSLLRQKALMEKHHEQ